MTIRTVQLFVNPRPRPRARRRIEALQRAFERRGVIVLVEESAAERLEIDARADHACSAGGDGTLRHVVDAVRRSERAVSVSAFPAGTVNLVARESGYPRAPGAFVARVLDGGGRTPHFIGLVGDTPVLACASVGPDSHAVAALSPMLKRLIGRGAYVFAFLALLVRWPRVAMVVRHDGGRVDCEAIYVAKGRYFAGPWSFAPDASVRERKLHVVTIERATRWRFFRFALLLLAKRPIEGFDGVSSFACVELAITGAQPAPVQADGDVVGRLPVEMRVSASAIDFS